MSVHIQRQSQLKKIPSNNALLQWAKLALGENVKTADITLRIINKKESADLNQLFRQKSGPTNVLSFDYQHNSVTGDVVLCAPLITSLQEWAHLVVHGVLHLMGYDHMTSKDAKIMEQKEIAILNQLGFDNPYLEQK
jgi:probable rRNA maturation factor